MYEDNKAGTFILCIRTGSWYKQKQISRCLAKRRVVTATSRKGLVGVLHANPLMKMFTCFWLLRDDFDESTSSRMKGCSSVLSCHFFNIGELLKVEKRIAQVVDFEEVIIFLFVEITPYFFGTVIKT